MAKTGVRAKKPLVILDFDGTLARVVPNPAQAKISAKTKAELEKIACVAKVVILTGRPRDFVQRQLVGAGGIRVIGLHGNEGLVKTRAMADLENEAAKFAKGIRGVVMESKKSGFALHFRKSGMREAKIMMALSSLLDKANKCSRMIRGRKCIEFLPKKAKTKSQVLWGIAAGNRNRRIVFVGDDYSDGEAIRKASTLPNFQGALIKSHETRMKGVRKISGRMLFQFLKHELAWG
ncbi:TPA: trehalose-phosphatase [Candidatus Micrarchaeota archaeon]|nr:trehalose-phosphatase [Candidatus Micrarchaeota archaeon]HIH30203.1 trehalose-phosphatase [Candidatus Micrarchaeota archaeon]